MEEIPGIVRNAVIQWVRGIYSGWVIKVLVFSKEKWLFPAWNVRWEVNLTIQLPSKSVCVIWLMSCCHCLRSWSIITAFYRTGGWTSWWKNKCPNFLRSGKWGQYFLKFDGAMIWYAGGCQRYRECPKAVLWKSESWVPVVLWQATIEQNIADMAVRSLLEEKIMMHWHSLLCTSVG